MPMVGQGTALVTARRRLDHAFDHDGKRPALREKAHAHDLVGLASLRPRAVAAEHARLRRRADMAHHGNPALTRN